MAVNTNTKEKFDKLNTLFSFLDTTDWSEPSYDNPLGTNADVSVPIKVICKINVNDSSSNHYENVGFATDSFTSPDFTIDATLAPLNVVTVNNSIQLPLDSNLQVVTGEYTIDYKFQLTDDAAALYVLEAQNEYNYLFTDPSPSLDVDINCAKGTFTVQDDTYLVVDNVSPSTTSREIKVTFPSDISASAVTTSLANLVLTSFYTNTQQVDLSLTLTYSFTDYDVQVKVTKHVDADVECDSNLCEVYCCLKSLYDRMEYARTKNRADYDRLREQYQRANFLAELIKNAESCAKDSDINSLMESLKEITNCTGDCGCSGTTSRLITSSNSTAVVSPFPTLLEYTSSGDTSRTITSLIGKSNAQFQVYDEDGNVIPIPSSSFNSATGKITFPYTIVSGLKYYVHILN